MIVLIGSRALNFYNKLKGRNPDDWDFLSDEFEKRTLHLKGEVLEFIYSNELNEQTNKEILNYCRNYSNYFIQTPIGSVLVAPIEILKVLKIGSLPIEKAKHQWDLVELEAIQLSPELINLAKRRELETLSKVDEQKNKFFNRYKIPRFFDHDELHRYISKIPAYLKVLKDNSPVEVDENKFKSLSIAEQKETIWEECLSLALERDLIPQIKNAPYLIEVIVSEFIKVKSSKSSALRWLSKLSIPGKLKDHPNWLAQWGLENQHLLIDGLPEWWELKIENLSEVFWIKLLD